MAGGTTMPTRRQNAPIHSFSTHRIGQSAASTDRAAWLAGLILGEIERYCFASLHRHALRCSRSWQLAYYWAACPRLGNVKPSYPPLRTPLLILFRMSNRLRLIY